jgi:D-alanyl-D-alanine carboxypeptidase (penicillin-binding protein 5/6)
MERQLLEEHIERALSGFYDCMNENATSLGLTRTHFAVAHGMHHPNNYSSAHDIATLSRIAM